MVTSKQLLADLNPLYRNGDEAWSGYVTEAPPAAEGHSRILLVNNSQLAGGPWRQIKEIKR